MSDTTKTSKVIERTEFTYDDIGQLKYTKTESGLETFYLYFLKGFSPKLLNEMISNLTLESGEYAKAKMQLTGPAHPHVLRAQYQRQTNPDGTHPPALISLYGYAKGTRDDAGMLVPDTELTLRGVAVDPDDQWKITFDKEVVFETTTLTQKETVNGVTKHTETTWYGWNPQPDCRRTRIMSESLKADTKSQRLESLKTSRLSDKDVVLERKRLSAFSTRVLCETEQNDAGAPVRYQRYGYDARGREVHCASYAFSEKDFTASTAEKQKPEHTRTTTWQDTANGTLMTVTHPDGRCTRTLCDGLQRPVRRELQRIAGDDQSAGNYCLIEELSYGLEGDVASQVSYDYLPGGLRRRKDGGALPENLTELYSRVDINTASDDAQGEETLTTESATISSRLGVRTLHQQAQTNLKNGGLQQVHRSWLPSENADKNSRVETTRVYDAQGRLSTLTEAVPDASGKKTARNWSYTYDDLDRRTSVTAPDKCVVNWAYAGLSNAPVKVSITKGDITRELGARKLKGDGGKGDEVASQTRGSETAPACLFDDKGVTRRNGDRLYREVSADNREVVWYKRNAGKDVSNRLISFKFDPIARTTLSSSTLTQALQPSIDVHTFYPALLGLCLTQRSARKTDQQQCALQSLQGEVARAQYLGEIDIRVWHDSLGRRSRVKRGQLEYLYRYNAQNQCEHTEVLDLRSGHRLERWLEYDAFGQEVARRYDIDGVLTTRYQQTWSASGKLLKKTLHRGGSSSASRTDTYTYDSPRDRLVKWEVEASEQDQICTAEGKPVSEQTYSYDMLNNLSGCATVWHDGSKETRKYRYKTKKPTALGTIYVTSTDAAGTQSATKPLPVVYYASGALKTNDRGEVSGYYSTGQLAWVNDKAGKVLSRYEYDAHGRLVVQTDARKRTRQLLVYNGDTLCGEVWQDSEGKMLKRRVLDEEAGLAVQIQDETGAVVETLFTLSDPQNGGGDELDPMKSTERRSIAFTPWGEAPLDALNAMNSGMAWNNQRPDPLTGSYHLGNGYRFYDPQYKMFGQADPWSPFGEAGLNDMAYCAGDPVNRHDPSGHIMLNRQAAAEELASLDRMIADTKPPVHEPTSVFQWLLAGVFGFITIVTSALAVVAALPTGGLSLVVAGTLFAVAIAGIVLDVTSLALAHTNPRLSNSLGWASFGLAFTDLAELGFKGVRKLVQTGQHLMSKARKAVKVRY